MKIQIDDINADGTESIFILGILEKNQRSKIKILSRECNSIIKDSKLSKSELN